MRIGDVPEFGSEFRFIDYFFFEKQYILGEKSCTHTSQYADGAAGNRNLPIKDGLDNECKR